MYFDGTYIYMYIEYEALRILVQLTEIFKQLYSMHLQIKT